MSYLSIAIQRQAQRHGLNQSDVARGCGLSRSYISRLFTGDSHELSDENFIAVLKVFSADQAAQAEMVAARCQDAKVGPGSEWVEIRIKDAGQSQEVEFAHVDLSPDAERAFAWLRSQCPLNPDLERHLVGYARLMGMK